MKNISGCACVFAVLLEEADSHGQTHDQRGRNGVPAAGKPVLYPLNNAVCRSEDLKPLYHFP